METEPTILKTIDHPDFTASIKSDGIVYIFFKDDMEITIDLQENHLIPTYNELTGGVSHPFLFEAGENITINKEARDNAVEMESRSPVGKSAVVVDNLAYTLIANFYLKFNKPKNPYRVFRNRQQALEWLKKV